MSRFSINLAAVNNEKELHEILKNIYMEGSMKLTQRREPDFFNSLEIDGKITQVVLGKDLKKNKIIGFGLRAIRELFVNGEVSDIGYLGNLRLLPEYRNGTMLARGFKFFKELHKDNRVKIYLTSIVEDNKSALKILTSGKAGLPKYNDFGKYFTRMIGLKKRKRISSSGTEIFRGNKKALDKICKFLNDVGKEKQFFPYYTPEDFIKPTGLLRGLSESDLYYIEKNGEILGVIGIWSQGNFKQTVVSDYSIGLKLLRVPWNLVSSILDIPKLPGPGKYLNYFYTGLIAVKNNDKYIFKILIEKVRDVGRKAKFDFMISGLHERDGLNSVIESYRGYKLKTRIFIVHYDDGLDTFKQLDDRIPYLEVGTL